MGADDQVSHRAQAAAERAQAVGFRSPFNGYTVKLGGQSLGYAIFCPEVSPAFVSVWYTLGMLVPLPPVQCGPASR